MCVNMCESVHVSVSVSVAGWLCVGGGDCDSVSICTGVCECMCLANGKREASLGQQLECKCIPLK